MRDTVRASLRRPVWAVAVLVVTIAASAAAQTVPGVPAPKSAATETVDPLGRATPRGTITGLNLAVHRKDFVSAARYLQLTRAQSKNSEQLATDLSELIDRHFTDPITSLSNAPEGRTIDGLPPEQEKVPLSMGKEAPFDIVLVHIKDPQAGLIWVVSSKTLADLPDLEEAASRRFERFFPEGLVDRTGPTAARWILWLATLVVPFVALWLTFALIMLIVRHSVTDRQQLEAWYAGLRRPLLAIVTLGVHATAVRTLGFSLQFRLNYTRVVLILLVIAVAWLLWRLLELSFARARLLALRGKHTDVQSLLLLAERVAKVGIFLLVVFAMLTIAGVDTTTALAGVGIGGVAVALGAQKTVENLLGGVFLLTDGALAVGDTCSISNRLGVVEDVTLRSVRLRTLEQTLLSVPAGILAQSTLENLTSRNKILLQTTLRLQYGSTAQQIRRILAGIRALLDAHPSIETSGSRIRLMNFGERAIELELFAYVLTTDWLEFLTVREELLLQIAALVEESGTEFAQPTVVYRDQQAGPTENDADAVSARSTANQIG
jgi:MscS family membrane protein